MRLLTASAIVTVALAFAADLDARELRGAPGAPPAHPAHSHIFQTLVDQLPVESDGAITMIILGPEVVNLTQVRDALTSGLIDVGNLLPLYYPAELPNMTLAGELALSSQNPHAMAAAITEYTVNCDSCLQEMADLGIVYTGSGSSDIYMLLTTRPVVTAEDLRGMRLRSGGAPFSRWAEHFGAVPATISVNDVFEAMSQGAVEGSIASIGDLLSFRLVDLVTHVTPLPLGSFFSTVNAAFRSETWEDMTAEERGQVMRAINLANARFTWRWGYDFPSIARAAADEAGIEFHEADASLVEAALAFAEADRATAAELSAARFGMDDAADRVAEFMGLVDKWTAINEQVGDEPEAMAQAMWDEIWSKVDLSTYGVR